jgi:DNA-binding transcriptional LysR family regulator
MTTVRASGRNAASISPRQLALIAFVNIAESGSINRTATVLNISQPSLTRTIQQLEDAVGGRLFDRSAKGVKVEDG